jgi:RNA ligase (TIGR02306 family)
MSFWKVTKQIVTDLYPIENADKIEVAQVLGWKCVVNKGKFKVGDPGIYLPIDSVIPEDERYSFMKSSKYRVRTVKLRGQISQGLFLPLSFFTDAELKNIESIIKESGEGSDVSIAIGVTHYEPPAYLHSVNEVEGTIPGYIRKTDQERIQNIPSALELLRKYNFEVTEKLDGSSMQVYYFEGSCKVCSRNLLLRESENSLQWKMAYKYDLPTKLKSLGLHISIQGELVGPGVQKNPLQLKNNDWYVYDIWDIDKQIFYTPEKRQSLVRELGLTHVPLIKMPSKEVLESIDLLMTYADGDSVINPVPREGLVYKSSDYIKDEIVSFKTISNKFLLKSED